jgi:hypothetical protein
MSNKIVVELNQKSIKNAIRKLKNAKKSFQSQMIPEYLERSALWIKNRANEILSSSDIGVEVVQDIASKWQIQKISNNQVILHNSSWKSAYVEFGVGIIGQSDKHPNADATGYEYNVDSPHKFGNGFWQFTVPDQSELDIPNDAIIYQTYSDNGLSIVTQGTQGVWYLYNAVEDFKLSERKRLWEEIKQKYLG